MPKSPNPQIFIIDDDWDDRVFIIEALQKRGIQNGFEQFENGQALSDYLSSEPNIHPDLILLDLNMPVKNGYETLIALKADESLKKIPVVIFTASTTNDDRKTCFALGCVQFISKPMSASGYDEIARFLHASFFPGI